MAFKRNAQEVPDTGVQFPKKLSNSSHNDLPSHITSYKKERNDFYLKNKNRFWTGGKPTIEEIKFISASKEKDETYRASIGMK